MEKIEYYLVLEKRPGDYNLVDINKLDICNFYVANTISAIDNFTLNFSEDEIKESIKRSNMVQLDYLEGQLKIVSDAKHNLKIITKDIFAKVLEFQNDKEFNRDLKNKIFGSYKKVIEKVFSDSNFINGLLTRFKNILKTNDKIEMFKIIEELPYDKSREIYIRLADDLIKIEKSKDEQNLRILEKINDAA